MAVLVVPHHSRSRVVRVQSRSTHHAIDLSRWWDCDPAQRPMEQLPRERRPRRASAYLVHPSPNSTDKNAPLN
jgi:hypothetical protein|eukprot:COSAG01_NODE_2463_length_7647_cov_6.492183_6_plen_73_part_00